MNKKILIYIIAITTIVLLIILINNKKVEVSAIYHKEDPSDGSTNTFLDENGNRYKVIYNAKNYLYEIFDANDNIVAVAQDENTVEEYINQPELMFAVNEFEWME